MTRMRIDSEVLQRVLRLEPMFSDKAANLLAAISDGGSVVHAIFSLGRAYERASVDCPECDGTGEQPGPDPFNPDCVDCDGQGTVSRETC